MPDQAFNVSMGLDTKPAEKQADGFLSRTQSKWNSKPLQLRLDTSKFPLGKITNDARAFDESIKSATTRVTAFAAAAGVFLTIRRSFELLVHSTIEVEAELAKIGVNLNTTAAGLKQFGSQVFNIARDTGQTFEVAAKAAGELSKQGLGVAETANRLKAALTLVRYSGGDASESVKDLTVTINTFKGEALSASGVVDKFVAISRRFANVSANDLTGAIERVGETAQQSGVSLNQLLSYITAIQRETGRGGSAIGTGLNSIFNRLNEPKFADKLQEAGPTGIATRSKTGELLPVPAILQNIANKYASLSKIKQEDILVDIAQSRQVGILRSLLESLADANGTVAQTTKVLTDTTGEGERVNAKYNDTLKARIQNTETSFKQLFSAIGQSGPSTLFKGLLDGVDSIRTSLSGDTASSLGKDLGDGIVKGLGAVLTGPGVVTALSLIVKAGQVILSQITAEGSSLLSLNGIAEARVAVQKNINDLLYRATEAERAQYEAANTLLGKKEAILAISARIAALDEASAISTARLVDSFVSTSLVGGARIEPRLGGNHFAGGYNPAVGREIAAIAGGVGGASAGARPVSIGNFAFGGGVTGPIVANSDEYMVKNYANGGSAIFNPDMVRRYGLPPGATKVGSAAGGYVPNAAGGVSVPLVITRDARQQLYDLGYSRADVDRMRPAEAANVLGAGTGKSRSASFTTPSSPSSGGSSSFGRAPTPGFGINLRSSSGASLSSADTQQLNSLFDSIKKAGSGDEARKLTAGISAFSQGLNKVSQSHVLEQVGKVLDSFDNGTRLAAREGVARANSVTPSGRFESTQASATLAEIAAQSAIISRNAARRGSPFQDFNRSDVANINDAFRDQSPLKVRRSLGSRLRDKLNGGAGLLGLSVAASFGSGFIKDGEGGTTEGAVRGAGQGALQGLGVGAAFGLPGAAAGLVIGGIVGALGKATQSVDEFASHLNNPETKDALTSLYAATQGGSTRSAGNSIGGLITQDKLSQLDLSGLREATFTSTAPTGSPFGDGLKDAPGTAGAISKVSAALKTLGGGFENFIVTADNVNELAESIFNGAITAGASLKKAADEARAKAEAQAKAGLQANAYLTNDPSRLSALSAVGSIGRGGGFQSPFGRARTALTGFEALISANPLSEEDIRGGTQFKRALATTQQGDALASAAALIQARIPGKVVTNQRGEFLQEGITSGLKNLSGGQNAIIAEQADILLKVLDQAKKGVDNAGGTGLGQTLAGGYVAGVKTEAYAGGFEKVLAQAGVIADKITKATVTATLQFDGTINLVSDILSKGQLDQMRDELNKWTQHRFTDQFDKRLEAVERGMGIAPKPPAAPIAYPGAAKPIPGRNY